MFVIRKIQEQAIGESVKNKSSEATAKAVVYGADGTAGVPVHGWIYSKVLFEKAFSCDVDVELLKSIKFGDDVCLMKIIPHGVIW